jgi:hypothetical protein
MAVFHGPCVRLASAFVDLSPVLRQASDLPSCVPFCPSYRRSSGACCSKAQPLHRFRWRAGRAQGASRDLPGTQAAVSPSRALRRESRNIAGDRSSNVRMVAKENNPNSSETPPDLLGCSRDLSEAAFEQGDHRSFHVDREGVAVDHLGWEDNNRWSHQSAALPTDNTDPA